MRASVKTRGFPVRAFVAAAALALAISSMLPAGAAAAAEQPNLARIAFWVPPDRTEEFAAAYDQQVVPLLERHGFNPSASLGRTTADSIFTRLLEFPSVPDFDAQRKRALEDSVSVVVWQSLGRRFGTSWADDHIQVYINGYQVPAGPGTRVRAGPGTTERTKGTGHWRRFDETDGPLGGEVAYIAEDLEGHIWFGAWGDVGVSRYDGREFRPFTSEDGLVGDRVGMILPDREGNVWIGATDGVSRYDGETFTNYTTEDGLAHNHSRPYLQDRQGNIWFGSHDAGATRFDGETFTTFTQASGLAHNNVQRGIVEDENGNIWFGTKAGLSRFDGNSFTTFLPGRHAFPGLVDRNGTLWAWVENEFSLAEGWVSRPVVFDGSSFTNLTTPDGAVTENVFPLLEDRHGVIWFGSWLEGASKYDGSKFVALERPDAPAGNSVWAVHEDREGHLWFGTDVGVSRYDRQFVTFEREYDLSNYGFSVYGSRGRRLVDRQRRWLAPLRRRHRHDVQVRGWMAG